MARITVDDCLRKVPNRFELVHIAAERSRQLDIGGHRSLIEDENEKCTLTALREIAEGAVSQDILYSFSYAFPGTDDISEDPEIDMQRIAQRERENRAREEKEAQERKEAELAQAENNEAGEAIAPDSQNTEGDIQNSAQEGQSSQAAQLDDELNKFLEEEIKTETEETLNNREESLDT